jgi:hypothetical protein
VVHASYPVIIDPMNMANFQVIFTNQGPYQQMNIRVINTFHQWLLFGLGYSSRANFMAYLGLRRNAFTVSYSYDVSVSKLSGNTAGSHELGISLSFKKRADKYLNFLEQR